MELAWLAALSVVQWRSKHLQSRLQSIHSGNEDIAHTAMAQCLQSRKPEPGAFIFRKPQAQHFVLTM
jgi:hypothetical protein